MRKTNAQARVPATTLEKLKWLDELLAEEGLSATAKLVAVRLFRHHNDDTGRCDPHQETIATGIGRSLRAVSRAVTELREAGWIEVHARRERADYVLVIARAETAESVEPSQKRRASYARSGVPATPEMACLVRRKWRTEPPTRTTKKTTQPTTAPAEAASADVSPAVAPEIPDQLETILPKPANENRPVGNGQTFSGWTIPDETIQGWVRGFTFIDVPAQLVSSAPYFAKKVAEDGRLQKLESRLRKLNAEARSAHISRKEARAADEEAGIERDAYGRNVTAMRAGVKSRFQW